MNTGVIVGIAVLLILLYFYKTRTVEGYSIQSENSLELNTLPKGACLLDSQEPYPKGNSQFGLYKLPSIAQDHIKTANGVFAKISQNYKQGPNPEPVGYSPEDVQQKTKYFLDKYNRNADQNQGGLMLINITRSQVLKDTNGVLYYRINALVNFVKIFVVDEIYFEVVDDGTMNYITGARFVGEDFVYSDQIEASYGKFNELPEQTHLPRSVYGDSDINDFICQNQRNLICRINPTWSVGTNVGSAYGSIQVENPGY